MTEYDVYYYTVDTFESLRNQTHIQTLLDASQSGKSIGFWIDNAIFNNVSQGRAMHALTLFLGMFRDCPRLFFTEVHDKVLLGNIVTALRGFDRIQFDKADYCFRRNNPDRALDVDSVVVLLDYRISNCKNSQERRERRSNYKPRTVLNSIWSLTEEDPTAAFACNWAAPPEITYAAVNDPDWESVPYAEQNDIMCAYLRNDEGHVCEMFYEFDKNHFIQNIGFATVHALKMAFNNPRKTSPRIVQNIIRTWLHACIDMYTSADERMPGGDELYIPTPKTPISQTEEISDYLMDLLSDLTSFIVINTTVRVVVEKYKSFQRYFEDGDVFEKHGESLLATLVCIRPFISPFDAMDGFAHFYINAAFAQLFLDACEDEFEGILKVYENLSDADIAKSILTPDIYKSAQEIFRAVLRQIEPEDMPPAEPLPRVVDLSFDPSMAWLFTRRILRQMPEYNRPQLAAARDIYDIPFVVQGEAFVLPMCSAVHCPLARAIRFDAFAALVCAVHPDPNDKVVELVSQMCIFNKPGERQHDYLYFQPRWTFGDHDEPPGTPDVYTGIINLSYANMEFARMPVGRSAPLASVKAGGYRRKNTATTPPITLPPGKMLVYKREPAESDQRGLVSWQCRLSSTMEASETGVPYMQVSIAVYRNGKANDSEVEQIKHSIEIMKVCGVMKNHIYSGKQGWEKARKRKNGPGPGAAAKKAAMTRRSMYPILYSQLTNANKNNTRKLFYENRMYLQRFKILQTVWAQTVLLVYDEETEQERLVSPREGWTFNEDVGYLPEIQRLTFEETKPIYEKLIKPVSNFSVGVTQKIVDDIYTRSEGAKDHSDLIYSNNPPPLRNLHGLLTSRGDRFLTGMTAPDWELNLFGRRFLDEIKK